MVRNVCACALDPRLVNVLVEDLPGTSAQVWTELEVFADGLEAIAGAVGD
jgi:hypothetical protein